MSRYAYLSEKFIEEFADKVDWNFVSKYQHLSEDFIREFADRVDWIRISAYQHLSESFIREFADRVNWSFISMYQHLSESFITEYVDRVDWWNISIYQRLSESFIRKYADRVDWWNISIYQHLSESFIREFADKVMVDRKNDNWLYKSNDFLKTAVKSTGLYECHDNFFYAYKGVRKDRYSRYNFQYRYLPGETYECFADGSPAENSFGLSVWTKEKAMEYCDELVIKCKIYYKDVARIVHDGGKIRCSKFTVLD